MTRPAAIGFLMTFVNGQPPHMMAAQNVTGTATITQCARMGAGGVTPAPTIFSASAATMAPTTSANNVSSRPRRGFGAFAAADGWALPHVTAMTIWIGITQSRKYATHPENVGNENSDTNARAIAITMMVAVTPSAGCLS